MNTPSPEELRRNRRKLIMIAAVFLAPLMIAAGIGMTGWMPGTRGNGEPIEPQRSFVDVSLTLDDGSRYEWRDPVEPRFTLLALPGPSCEARCREQLAMMRNARITMNQNMDRVRLIYLGDRAPVADALAPEWQVARDDDNRLAEFRPTGNDALSAILVQSNGTALSLYPDGFNPTGLRKDMKKVVK
ncbi:MAG: hypothetical protein ABIR16_05150 [Dokdonella sp.]